jgi:hypothetical protein
MGGIPGTHRGGEAAAAGNNEIRPTPPPTPWTHQHHHYHCSHSMTMATAMTGTAAARDEVTMTKDTNYDKGRWAMTTRGHEQGTTTMERRQQHEEEEQNRAGNTPNDERLVVWATGNSFFISYFNFKKLTWFIYYRYYWYDDRLPANRQEHHDTAKTNTMPAGTKDSSKGMMWDNSDTREVPPPPP